MAVLRVGRGGRREARWWPGTEGGEGSSMVKNAWRGRRPTKRGFKFGRNPSSLTEGAAGTGRGLQEAAGELREEPGVEEERNNISQPDPSFRGNRPVGNFRVKFGPEISDQSEYSG